MLCLGAVIKRPSEAVASPLLQTNLYFLTLLDQRNQLTALGPEQLADYVVLEPKKTIWWLVG